MRQLDPPFILGPVVQHDWIILDLATDYFQKNRVLWGPGLDCHFRTMVV